MTGREDHSSRDIYRRSRFFRAAASAMALLALSAPFAAAQQFPGLQTPQDEDIEPPRSIDYELRISPRLTLSDNVNLDPEGFEAEDALASIEVEGGVLIDRLRFSGLVSGKVEFGSYLNPATVTDPLTGVEADRYDRFVVDQNVRGAGTAELKPNLFYLDVAATAQQQALDEEGAFSANSIAANQEQAKVFSYSVSPYVFSKLMNGADVEARYRYTSVHINDADAAANVDDFLNDSESHELLAEFNSGRLYDRFGFSVRGYATKTTETGSDVLPEVDFSQRSVSADVRYPLSRKLSVTGTLGYDDIDTGGNEFFEDDKLTGIFYKAGLLATPGRRTRVQVEAGNRYDGTWIEADATYRYSSRLGFRANASRTLQTQAIGGSRSANLLQGETVSYADQLRALQGQTSQSVLEQALFFNSEYSDLSRLQSGLSASDRFTVSVVGRSKLADFLFSMGYDDSDFGFEETKSYIFAGSLERDISRNTRIYARGNYQSAKTGLIDCLAALSVNPDTAGLPDALLETLCQDPSQYEREDQTVSILAGVSRDILANAEIFAQMSRTQRFANDALDEYIENALTIGLTFEF